MTTARMTIGTLFTTVSTTANAATSLVGSVAKSADMLTAFVDKHAEQQRIQYAKEKVLFEEKLNSQIAMQLANEAETVMKEKAKSESFAKAYDTFYEKVAAIKV